MLKEGRGGVSIINTNVVGFRAVPVPGLVLYEQTHMTQMFVSGRLGRAAGEVREPDSPLSPVGLGGSYLTSACLFFP